MYHRYYLHETRCAPINNNHLSDVFPDHSNLAIIFTNYLEIHVTQVAAKQVSNKENKNANEQITN